jgi:hypothetical protein
MLINEKKLYHTGIDKALLYAAVISAACAIGNLFSKLHIDTNLMVLYLPS